MSTDPREAVGDVWDPALQRAAQDRGWAVLQAAAAAMRPGMTDLDGRGLVDRLIKDSGASQQWHASQVRFGSNTMLPFGKTPDRQHVLQEGDIFFLDIGPVYDGHEGDVGSAFTLGTSPHGALIDDSREVFQAVKAHWLATGATGEALYDFARAEAAARGRTLALDGASGHRLGDFPHRIHHRGKLKSFDATPAPDRWILEIHLIDDASRVGAFYEDLL
jgi:Xaa-Pro aminopeptidase